MTTVAAKLLPQSLRVTTHPNPSTKPTPGAAGFALYQTAETAKSGSFRRSKNDPVAEQ
ncbi:pentatricopeptide repeat-containing protein [Pyrus ussuriensis x Pyrus communis]|uniref:Pentatricopeptide repeat-containing protein n=1 Tax=Pyrus ussuriensis x Pyrus communis TaxID=2448454 RepID=A0A5N5FKQ9_9ROSA|nr:pentatricopeptide repeat-containing protein [Pyrus ussuriensis x Pyrus communis]